MTPWLVSSTKKLLKEVKNLEMPTALMMAQVRTPLPTLAILRVRMALAAIRTTLPEATNQRASTQPLSSSSSPSTKWK